MGKITILLIALLLLTACSNEIKENNTDISTSITTMAESSDNSADIIKDWGEPDFRNVNWGMSKGEVVSIEGTPDTENPLTESHYRLVYNVIVADYETELVYYFENDALVRAEYRFDCNDKTDLQLNTMYYKVLDEYVSEYGPSDDSHYSNLNFSYDESEYPFISDPDFDFGGLADYTDDWNNANDAVISSGMHFFVPFPWEDDKSVEFNIEHTAIGDNFYYNIISSS